MRCLSSKPGRDLAFDLGRLADDLELWDLATDFYQRSLRRGLEPAVLYNLGRCHWHLGRLDEAETALGDALRLAPAERRIEEFARQVRDERAACERLPWWPALRNAIALPDDVVTLHPLRIRHSHAVAAQFRDHEAARLSGLPTFRGAEEARDWIARQRRPQRAACAVLHRRHGCIGVITLKVHREDALFFFLIGPGFRNRGFGSQALRQAVSLAQAMGVCRLYATVYAENRRSRHVVTKAGLALLDVSALGQEDLRVYCKRLGEPSEDDLSTPLVELLGTLGSPLRVVRRKRPQGSEVRC